MCYNVRVTRSKTIVSLQTGDTAATRRLLSATATNSDPTLATDGWNLPNCDFLHIYTQLSGGATAVTVTPWYYSYISEVWYEGEIIAFSTTDKLALVEVQNEQRVYFRVNSINAGTFELWAGGVPDEHE